MNTMEYSYWVEDKIMTEGNDGLIENTLGLVGEAGEVAEKIKKLIRDSSRFSNQDIVKELGDVVFYATALANYFESSLEEVIELNVDKLDDRQARGVLGGAAIDAADAASSLAKPFVQIGIFSVEKNAGNTATAMRTKGMVPTVEQQSLNGKTFWRVIVGPAQSKSDLAQLLKKVKLQGFSGAYAVRN